MTDWENVFDDIRGGLAVVILAIVGIYFIGNVAATLIPGTPFQLGSALIGVIAGGASVWIYQRVMGEF